MESPLIFGAKVKFEFNENDDIIDSLLFSIWDMRNIGQKL